MPRLTVDDLKRVRAEEAPLLALRTGGPRAAGSACRAHVLVCAGTGCVSCASLPVSEALEREIAKQGLQEAVQVVRTGCQGFCAEGPVAIVQPDGVFYCGLKEKDAATLVQEHLVNARPVPKLMYTPPGAPAPVAALAEIPFFARQRLVALRNRGVIDPERIEDYIARDGYVALTRALTEMTADEIIREIKLSGLRGRGGGGFPAGIKWATCRQAALHRGVDPVVVPTRATRARSWTGASSRATRTRWWRA